MNNLFWKLIIGAVVIVVAIFLIMAFVNSRSQDNFVQEIDRKLSDEERGIYESRIADVDQRLASAQNDDEKFNLLMSKGFNLYGLGKLADAKQAFLDAADIKPREANVYAALYQTQLDMNDNKGARSSIKKALSINETDPDIWKKYLQLEIDRFERSTDDIRGIFAEALNKTAASPNAVDTVTFYATYLEKIGDLQGAKENWEKAISLNPANKAAYEAEIERINGLMSE